METLILTLRRSVWTLTFVRLMLNWTLRLVRISRSNSALRGQKACPPLLDLESSQNLGFWPVNLKLGHRIGQKPVFSTVNLDIDIPIGHDLEFRPANLMLDFEVCQNLY